MSSTPFSENGTTIAGSSKEDIEKGSLDTENCPDNTSGSGYKWGKNPEVHNLTPTRTRLLKEILKDPGAVQGEWADRADCSDGVIYSIREENQDVIEDVFVFPASFLDMRVESRETIIAIAEHGDDADINVHPDTVNRIKSEKPEVWDWAVEVGASDDTDDTEEHVETDNGVGSYSGPPLDGTMQHFSERPHKGDTDAPDDAPTDTPDTPAKDKLDTLTDRIEHVRDTARREHELSPSDSTAARIAVAEQLLDSIEE